MSQSAQHFYDFGPFRLDLGQRVLLQDGQRVSLPPKVLETLRVLVENHGRIVEKDELMKRVWPDTFVEEGNLTVNIFLLRKVLGKALSGIAPIETIPRRGYCFVAPVETVPVAVCVDPPAFEFDCACTIVAVDSIKPITSAEAVPNMVVLVIVYPLPSGSSLHRSAHRVA